ncbi:MAG TPA: hypothetical protein VG269_27265 [Tepidisphaeraceae bacterium]|nr:hypothetical protein [Tepidisphaeraceae bacterium]
MIRRVFTAVSVLAFALLLTAQVMGVGDPRYTLLGFGFVLHDDYRMAIHFPGGRAWAFSYARLYVPVMCCFLAAIAWNVWDWHRKRSGFREHSESDRCHCDLAGITNSACPRCGTPIPVNESSASHSS